MRHKRLLISVSIAFALLLGLMAGLRGVPVEAAPLQELLAQGGPDGPYDGFYCYPWYDFENCSSEFLVDGGNNDQDWGFKFSGSSTGLEDSVFVVSDTTTFYLDFNFDWVDDADSNGCWTSPETRIYIADYLGGGQCRDSWGPLSRSTLCEDAPGYECTESNSGRCRVEWNISPSGPKCVRWVGMEQDVQHYEKEIELVDFWTNDPLDWITYTEAITGCTPIESLVLDGPITGSVGEGLAYTTTLVPEDATEPITWTWGANGPVLVDDLEGDNATVTWWESGTYTVSVTAENCGGGFGGDAMQVKITGTTWSPPFTIDPMPDRPIVDCSYCSSPDWSIWQIGNWFSWLWCNLKCWLSYILDFLYWIWRLLYTALASMVNTFMEAFWNGIVNLIKAIDYYGRQIALVIRSIFQVIADFARDIVFWYRDNIWDPFWTIIANWIEGTGDAVGDFLQMAVYEFRDWITGWFDALALFFDAGGDFFSFLSMAASEISAWLYNVLTEVGDYFNSWSTGLGNFLAMVVYEIRDWLDVGIFPPIIDWLDRMANWFYAAADNTRRVRDWIFDFMTELGITMNETVDNTTLFIANAVREFRDWGHDILTWYGNYVYGNIMAIGEFLATSIRRLANLVITLVLLWANVVSALATFVLTALEMVDIIVNKALEAVGLLTYLSELVEMVWTGFKDALNASDTADIYETVPGLANFWLGLEFFEEQVGPSPLGVLNLIAIGMIGVNLTFWTIGQAGDLMEDIARF